MPVSESFGDALGDRLHARATSFATRAWPRVTIAATEIRYDEPEFVRSRPPVEEDAFLVTLFVAR